MRVREQELPAKLARELPQIIYISGDEILLVQEACALYRKTAIKAGFTEREYFNINARFDFKLLSAASASLSLFAEKKLLVINLETIKLGKNGSLLLDFLQNLPHEVNVLLHSAKLDSATQNTTWFKAITKAGWVIQIWPVGIDKLPGWIIQRAKLKDLSITYQAAEILAYQVEGNLLAAKQEIDKLVLLYGVEKISADMIIKAVSDLSSYDVFQLADSALSDSPGRTIKIFRNLLAEGMALQVIIWAIGKDLRELVSMKLSGKSLAAHDFVEYMHPVIWQRRMPLFAKALARNTTANLISLLGGLSFIDQAGKGQIKANAELAMERLFVSMYKGESGNMRALV